MACCRQSVSWRSLSNCPLSIYRRWLEWYYSAEAFCSMQDKRAFPRDALLLKGQSRLFKKKPEPP